MATGVCGNCGKSKEVERRPGIWMGPVCSECAAETEPTPKNPPPGISFAANLRAVDAQIAANLKVLRPVPVSPAKPAPIKRLGKRETALGAAQE